MKKNVFFVLLAISVLMISTSVLNANEVEVSVVQNEISSGNIILETSSETSVQEGETPPPQDNEVSGRNINLQASQDTNSEAELEEFLDRIVSSRKIEYTAKTGRSVSANIGSLSDLAMAKDWTLGKSNIAFGGDEVYIKKLGDYTISAIVSGDKTRFLVVEGAGLSVLGNEYIIKNGGFLDDQEENTLVIYADSESDFERAKTARALGPVLGFDLIAFLNKIVSSKEIEYTAKTGESARTYDIYSLSRLAAAKDWTLGKSRFALVGENVYVKKIGKHTITAIVNDNKTILLNVEGPGIELLGEEYIIAHTKYDTTQTIGGFLGGGKVIEGVYVVYADANYYDDNSYYHNDGVFISDRFQWLEFIYKYGSNGYETLDKDVVAELGIKEFNDILNVMMFGQKIDIQAAFSSLNKNNNYFSRTVESGEYKGLTEWYGEDYSILIKNGMPLFIEGDGYYGRDKEKVMDYVRNNSIRIYVDPKDLGSFIIDTKLYSIKVRYDTKVVRIQEPLSLQKAEAAKQPVSNAAAQTSTAKKPAAKTATSAKK
jgi:hypothetical protein